MPFSALAGCTVVTADYLPWVRVTAASFAEHHPGAEFAVLVIDEPESSQLRDDDQFTLLRPADVRLSDDELAWMDLIYSPVELSCALKPWLIRRMLDQAEVVLYIDADICVYAPLTEVADQARQCAVVLSPHSLAPRTDPRMPDDDALLQFGQFNGGFLAVSRNGRDFVDWWAAKCARESTDWNPAVPRRYLDQRWLDLAIGYFDSQLTRDPGINLARWNMYQRDFDLVDGSFVVDGGPLRCFHFSAFNPADPTNIRRDGYTHPKVDPQHNPALRELLEDYARRLLAAGWKPAGDKPAPRTVAGIELTPVVRATIRAALIDAERLGAVPVDAARNPEKLAAWLQSPVRADLNISWYEWGQRATSAVVPAGARTAARARASRPKLDIQRPEGRDDLADRYLRCRQDDDRPGDGRAASRVRSSQLHPRRGHPAVGIEQRPRALSRGSLRAGATDRTRGGAASAVGRHRDRRTGIAVRGRPPDGARDPRRAQARLL